MEINLTGKGGLAPKHFGDTNGEQKPNLRYQAEPTQMVQGFYNPFRNYGYLSPSNKTSLDVGTILAHDVIGSTLYDDVLHKGYFADRGKTIMYSDGLDDFDLKELINIKRDDSENIVITDIQIYELRGQRRLFYAYNRGETSELEEHGDIGFLSIGDKIIDNLKEGTRSTETDNDAYRFAQYFDFGRRMRIAKVRVKLQFTGTNDSFNLVCRIRPHSQAGPNPTPTLAPETPSNKLPYNRFGPTTEPDAIAAVLGESLPVPASSLSTTNHEDVEFVFEEPVFTDGYRLRKNEVWVSIEPENMSTFDGVDNSYSIVITDVDDMDFSFHGKEMKYNDDSLNRNDWSSFAPLISETASPPPNNDIIFTHTFTETPKYIPRIVISGHGPTTSTGTLQMIVELNGTVLIKGGISGFNDYVDDGKAAGQEDFATYTFREEAQGAAYRYSSRIDILRELNPGDVLTVRTLTSGTTTGMSARVEMVDFTERYQMAVEVEEAEQEDKWLSEVTVNNFRNDKAETKLISADNGLMYILNDHAVHAVSGAITDDAYGNITSNALVFPSYFTLKDAIDWRGNLLIVVNHRELGITPSDLNNFQGSCGVYVWDRLTTQIRMRDYVPINGVREIRNIYISPGGAPRIICISSNGITQIREYSGGEFNVIKEIGFNSFPTFKSSLSVAGDNTYWLGADGVLYAYGKSDPQEREGLFMLNRYQGDIFGAILYGGGRNVQNAGNDNFYISTK